MKANKRIRYEAKQLLGLCYIDGIFDEGRALHLIAKFVRSGPQDCLAILVEFERMLKLELARHTATVESAAPLPAEAAATIRARLEEVYGRGLNFSFTHNPALIGGMRIKVGSDVYDGSVQGRLAVLEERFS